MSEHVSLRSKITNNDAVIQSYGIGGAALSNNKKVNESEIRHIQNIGRVSFGIEDSIVDEVELYSLPDEFIPASLALEQLDIIKQKHRDKISDANDNLDSGSMEKLPPSPYSSMPDVDGLPFMPPETIGEQVLREFMDSKGSLKAYVPDHVHAASKECLNTFMKVYLLPRLQQSSPLSREEIIKNVAIFKEQFAQNHPKDFDPNWELLQSVSFLLLDLDIECEIRQDLNQPHWEEMRRLVDRAKRELLPMYKQDPQVFYSI